ncbi:hypothetical protein [Aliivibrio fischeri]|uniref:hypothetical protein n=1 Tax=Aliivibrio fischeri TaxID=668 RepID=UPI00084C1BC6|nr:hypothetical protein [Aliivibrio fischeri]OED57232.1 hypothetical protein BEI47_11535 [Aliivibrio fischeri]
MFKKIIVTAALLTTSFITSAASVETYSQQLTIHNWSIQTGYPAATSFEGAQKICNSANYDNYNDWRLPTNDEISANLNDPDSAQEQPNAPYLLLMSLYDSINFGYTQSHDGFYFNKVKDSGGVLGNYNSNASVVLCIRN